MAYNKNKTQNFKPSTKVQITENLRKKARENMHIKIVAKGDIVVYKAIDGTRPFYKVGRVSGADGMYDVEVIKLDSQGNELTQRFTTTMDKLERFWLQPADAILLDGTTYKIRSIFLDADNETSVEVVNVNTGGITLLFWADLDKIEFA